MTRTKLRAAIVEAQRFLDRAKYLDYLIVTESDQGGAAFRRAVYGEPKAAGAVRRASMDLTRALAELRRRG